MSRKITLYLHAPSPALDGSQDQTHGIEWSASGHQELPTAISRVTLKTNAASEPGTSIRKLKRECVDGEALLTGHMHTGRRRTRNSTRASNGLSISNADDNHLRGDDDDQRTTRPRKKKMKMALTEEKGPRILRQSHRERSGQAAVQAQTAALTLTDTDRDIDTQNESREKEQIQPQFGAHSVTRETDPALHTISPETHFQVLEELQKVKDDLEKAITGRNEMQELLESRTSQLSAAQSFMSQTDSISAADLTRMVESLNHDIFQVAASLADTPKFRRTRRQTCATGSQVEDYQRNSQIAIGKHLTTVLKKAKPFLYSAPSKAEECPLEPDALIRISVQVCCCAIATTWTGFRAVDPNHDHDVMLSKIYTNLYHTEPIVARRWRSMTRAQIKITTETRKKMVDFVHKQLTSVLITAGWPRDRRTQVPVSFGDAILTIVDLTLRINTAIGQEIVSMDIQPIEVLPETIFDSALMDDSLADVRSSITMDIGTSGVVAGTAELWLQMVSVGGGSAKMGNRIFLKPKVVLESTFRRRES